MSFRWPFAVGTFLALLLHSASALAEGWYLGGSLGGSRIEVSADQIEDAFRVDDGFVATDTSLDKADFGWKGYAGYRLHDRLAIELGYVDLGEATFDTTIVDAPPGNVPSPPFSIKATATASGPELSAVANVPLPGPLLLLARVGAMRWEAEFTERVPEAGVKRVDIREEDVDLMYGAGIDLGFNAAISARVEWERFENVGRGIGGRGGRDVDFYSVGLVVSF
jgi:opacity protein-like surface antigen